MPRETVYANQPALIQALKDEIHEAVDDIR